MFCESLWNVVDEGGATCDVEVVCAGEGQGVRQPGPGAGPGHIPDL